MVKIAKIKCDKWKKLFLDKIWSKHTFETNRMAHERIMDGHI